MTSTFRRRPREQCTKQSNPKSEQTCWVILIVVSCLVPTCKASFSCWRFVSTSAAIAAPFSICSLVSFNSSCRKLFVFFSFATSSCSARWDYNYQMKRWINNGNNMPTRRQARKHFCVCEGNWTSRGRVLFVTAFKKFQTQNAVVAPSVGDIIISIFTVLFSEWSRVYQLSLLSVHTHLELMAHHSKLFTKQTGGWIRIPSREQHCLRQQWCLVLLSAPHALLTSPAW